MIFFFFLEMASEIKQDPDNVEDYVDSAEDDDPEFKICIKGLDSSNTEIVARKSDLIETIKQRYFQITGKPVDAQRLIFRGGELKNYEPLHYYGITGNAILHVAFKRLPQSQNNNNQQQQQQQIANNNNNNNQGLFGNIFNRNIPQNINNNNNNNNNQMDEERLNLLANPNNDRNRIPVGNINNNQQIQNNRMDVDNGLFSVITCITAYGIVCCIVPLISIPDIVTLIMVNDWDFNYNERNTERDCIWSVSEKVNISWFLNIGSIIAILIYLAFALWLFWYLKVSNLIQQNGIQPQRLQFEGCYAVLASTKTMNYIWWILNFGLLCIASYGIGIYENDLNRNCRVEEIGILLIVWSIIHLLFSFCICCPLCCSCLFGMNSNNVFANQ